MADYKRTDRLNSLLKQVLSEVIKADVKNPNIHELSSITKVDISRDLHFAKVYVSIIANQTEKEKTIKALQSASGYIAITAAKKVTLRYFPQLTFMLDNTVEDYIQIDKLLDKINTDKKKAS